jgi:putative copper resistance protein D
MGGTTLGQVDRATISVMVSQTAMGWAWLARVAALVLALGLALWPRLPNRVRATGLTGAGFIAVASLAWFGHGAAGEGARGLIHLVADIVHLLATSAWIGALPMLLVLVGARGAVTPSRIAMARSALAGFATAGTAMVGAIVVSGLINGAFLIAPGALPSLGAGPYGRILIAKLLLFGLMLVCAALNRFRLAPRLAAASRGQDVAAALAALRGSIMIEALLALLVLGSVGWLGTLEPPGMAG